MLTILGLSVGAALVAVTLTRSTVTAPWRYKMLGVPFIGPLFNCPYCMCHWTGCLFALYLGGSAVDYLVHACIVTGLAVGYAGLLNRLWHFDDRTIDELSALLVEAQKALERHD